MLQAFTLGMMRRGGWSGQKRRWLEEEGQKPERASPVAQWTAEHVPQIPTKAATELPNRLEGGGCGGDVAAGGSRRRRPADSEMWLIL